jgi:hypothetical protein
MNYARNAICSQYHAALDMLQQAVEKCPDARWNHPGDANKFWQVVYHTLFFTDLYLHQRREDFRPWAHSRRQYEQLSKQPSPQLEPYGKEEMQDYLNYVRRQVDEKLMEIDLEADSSGFHWLPFGKLELQIYNIRHIQQHTGELMERLGACEGIEVDWVALHGN